MGQDEADDDMKTVGVFLQKVFGPSGDDLNLEIIVVADDLIDRKDLRSPADQAKVDDAKGGLELSVLQKVVGDDFRDRVFADFDDHADAFFVGFVADVGDAVDDLFPNKVRDIFDHRGFVDLIRNLIDDDPGFAVVHLFDVIFGTDGDRALASPISIEDALAA